MNSRVSITVNSRWILKDCDSTRILSDHVSDAACDDSMMLRMVALSSNGYKPPLLLTAFHGMTGSTRTNKYDTPSRSIFSAEIGRRKVNGGNSVSASPGYTERNEMSAPRDMKSFVSSLITNGHELFAKSIAISHDKEVDMQATSVPPDLRNS